ncbi:MAG: methylated-DNA--[protein]-cysteine S-methyltransferase [Betaproteobacteria bacterium]|nr:methylated-DNA--[protein]-cysteine S-methyltransferase [Betaproteobacteria bacterium]
MLEIRDSPRFRRPVWKAIAAVPFGQTITYGELARRAGAAGSARAAGAATGRNPIGVVVPCHRIMGSDGSLTGYAGGWRRSAPCSNWRVRWASNRRSESPRRRRAERGSACEGRYLRASAPYAFTSASSVSNLRSRMPSWRRHSAVSNR